MTSVFVVEPAFSTALPRKLTFSRRRVVERPTLLRLMKIVLPKRHFPFLRFSFAERLARVVRLRLTVSLILPLHAERGAPAGSLIVPRARMRTRLPTILAVSELPRPVKLTGRLLPPPVAGALAIVTNLVAVATLPALSAKVTVIVAEPVFGKVNATVWPDWFGRPAVLQL